MGYRYGDEMIGLACLVVVLLGIVLPPAAAPQSPAADKTASAAVERIKDEGLNRSQLMDTLEHLSDAIGPRLTNSPQFREAARWTRDRLRGWGLSSARVEPWGPFGRGWSLRRFSAQVVEPQVQPLIAYPKAWSSGTIGELVADVVFLDAGSVADLEGYRGKLRGKIVLGFPVRTLEAQFAPRATRYTEFDLVQFGSDAPYPPNNATLAPPRVAERTAAARLDVARLQFVIDEGAALLIEPSRIADAGVLAVGAAAVPEAADATPAMRSRPWQVSAPLAMPQIVMSVEHYNRLARMIRRGERVRMAVVIGVQFHDEDLMSSNTIAEIPGTDLSEEVVMLGAHLDSWHAGTGATDNGAGVAVTMEAIRIIQALGLRPRRTIRLALWGGHEQGGGARQWVETHLTGPPRTAQYDRFSAYLNVDAGTGKFRGVYLFGNEGLRPIFRGWLEPFRGMGASVLTINSDWESDFIPFDQAGLPVISFIQDEIELETLTHHTNQDVLDHVLPEDLRQGAVLAAAFVYQAAMRDEKLPRKAR